MESKSNPITLKIASLTKNKRLGHLPTTFNELRAAIENQIKDERPTFGFKLEQPVERDFLVRYKDGDEEIINVSDDEDLQTAYQVAAQELNGRLTLKVDFKAPLQVPPEYFSERASFNAGPAQNLSYRPYGLDDSISMTQRSSSLVIPPLNLGGAGEFVNIPSPSQ